jgi:hypothetical protein
VDVQKVPLFGDPAAAVVRVTVPEQVDEVRCDALVAGAGMGGIAAAITPAGLESCRKGGKWIDTPELSFSYS